MKSTVNSLVFALGWAALITLLARPLDAAVFQMWGLAADETDGRHERSYLGLRKDFGTGCQYLVSPYGGITPRLDQSGKQVCKP